MTDKWRYMLSAGLLGIRASIGAGLAFGISSYAGLEHPIFALIAAILVTEYSASETWRLGRDRMIATALGAAIALSVLMILPRTLWSVGFGIMLAFSICQLANIGAGAKLAAYLCALVILDHGGNPLAYTLHRLVETGVGAVVALGISRIPRLVNLDRNV